MLITFANDTTSLPIGGKVEEATQKFQKLITEVKMYTKHRLQSDVWLSRIRHNKDMQILQIGEYSTFQ